YTILTGIFCSCLIISNILAFKVFNIGNIVLPTAVILFPIIYIINDVLAEIYGFNKAKKVIILGFVMNILAVVAYKIAIELPHPIFFKGNEAFALVLSNSFRVLIASLFAYLIGSLTNSFIMVKLKEKCKNSLMFRCVVSTFFGETIDAIIFISIAFFGTMPLKALIIMILSQAIFKTAYEIIVFPITNIIIKNIKKLN
ncbi:MAG: queuosine precursor transporter, partial [Clostridia bacterium]